MTTPNHPATLRQIVMDMHRTRVWCDDGIVQRNDAIIAQLGEMAEAIRALAEAVLAIHAQDGIAADRQARDPLGALRQDPGAVLRAHLDTFGSER